MKAEFAPLTRPQRLMAWGIVLAVVVAGLALWQAHGVPVLLLSAFRLC